MEQIEELYYALGELCYAIAKVDGTIRKEEKDRLHAILETEFRSHPWGIASAEMIFQILEREGMNSGTAYEWALHEIKLNSQYVSETLKTHFISVINKVADTFPPLHKEGKELVQDFIQELKKIHGDPVFSHLTEDSVGLLKQTNKSGGIH